MYKLLQSLPSLAFFFSFVILLQYTTSSAMFAATPKEASSSVSLRGNQVRVPASEGSVSFTSLSLSCASDMQVTDYNLPLSCVSGYVYLNGSPVEGATVAVRANGVTVMVETAGDGSGAAPYFMVGLSSEPLEVEPGDEVTMTAEFGGQSKALTFVAQGGSQQVDVVLPQDIPPIATIRRITPRDVRQGSDSMTFAGSGADGDGSDVIQAYRFRLNDEVISTQASFTLEANALENLPLGSQTISFQVQDDEGTWSQEAQQSILIRDSSADMAGDDSWTLLIYAVGDNNLDPWMGDYANSDGMLYRLRTAGAQENVQVGILYDGAEIGDSSLYTLAEDGSWTEEAWAEDEARMDEAETLRDFIEWGYQRFESDNYALSLVDHASGVVGFGLDESTDPNGSAFLTPLELRSAIQAATNDGSRKLEVLQYDGHSFGLLEDAAIGRGLAHYIITSPNSSWSIYAYEQYRQLAGSASSPKAYAQAVAERYAQQVGSHNLPVSISVFDMARFEAVNSAVSTLGDTLLDYRNADPQPRTSQLRAIREVSQKYDSGGELALTIDNADSYVDIYDFAFNLQAEIDDATVIQAASTVNNIIAGDEPFVLYESHQSGQFDYYDSDLGESQPVTVTLDNAHGIGIFYPLGINTEIGSAFQQYVRNNLFDTTRNSGWTRFLAQGMPPALGDPPPMPSDLLIPPLLPEEAEINYHLFLPSVVR